MLLSGLGGAFFDDTTAQRTMQDGTNVKSGLPSGSRGTSLLDNRGRNEGVLEKL